MISKLKINLEAAKEERIRIDNSLIRCRNKLFESYMQGLITYQEYILRVEQLVNYSGYASALRKYDEYINKTRSMIKRLENNKLKNNKLENNNLKDNIFINNLSALFVLLIMIVSIGMIATFYEPMITGITGIGWITGAAALDLKPGPSDGTDTYLREDSNNSNFGNVTQLQLGLTVDGTSLRPVFYFNISNISSTSTVTSAEFWAYVAFASSSTNISARLYRLTANFIESEATWLNSSSTSTWTAGGQYASNIEAERNISDTLGWYSWNIKDLVQSWVNGTNTNYGVIIIGDTQTNNNRILYSSDYTADTGLRPSLNISYSPNVAPSITSITDNSNSTSPTNVGSRVNFTVTWNDQDSSQANIYVCNSTNINYTHGCVSLQYCNTSLSATTTVSCQYTAVQQDNTTVTYYAAACDNEQSCSNITSAQTFNVNHNATMKIINPNGGETVNQSQGNYTIKFNVTEQDNDKLSANLYYSLSQGLKQNLIASGLNLTRYCTDSDSTFSTQNNCSYSWNTSGIGVVGISYWLDIELNDTFVTVTNSSNSSFSIVNLLDATAPVITNITITQNISSGETIIIKANATDEFISMVWADVNLTDGTLIRYNMTKEGSTVFYNISYEARKSGTYYYRIYANDSLGNVNNSALLNYSVAKPNVTTLNEQAPSKALPNSVVLISGQINNTDLLRGARAYLNSHSGFSFQADYPKNQSLGDIPANTANNLTTVYWYLAVPLTESTYVMNITYYDNHSNSWTGSNFNVQTTTNFGNSVVVSADGGGAYYQSDKAIIRARVEDNTGTAITNASVNVTVNYPNSSVLANLAQMTNEGAGYYNYTIQLSNNPTGVYNARVIASSGSSSSIAQTSFSVLSQGNSSSSSNGTFIDIVSYVEIEAGNPYAAEIHVKDGTGNYVNADSVSIKLYEPLGALFIGPVAPVANISTGRYLYNRSTTASYTGGHWIIETLVAKNGNTFNASKFFKISSGPFDVRDVNVIDNIVPTLGVTVVLENKGGSTKDMVLNWNLSKFDTGELLDSGQDTVGVAGGASVTHTIVPTTSFIGQVKITFLGYYGTDFVERAGAIKAFITQAAEAVPAAPSGGGGGGGWGGISKIKDIPTLAKKTSKLEIVEALEEVELAQGETKSYQVIVNNTGKTELNFASLNITSINSSWVKIYPSIRNKLKQGEEILFNIKISAPKDAPAGRTDFIYVAQSEEAYAIKLGILKIKPLRIDISKEIKELQERIGIAHAKINQTKEQIKERKDKKGKDKRDKGKETDKIIEETAAASERKINNLLELADEKIMRSEASSDISAQDALQEFDEAKRFVEKAEQELESLISEITEKSAEKPRIEKPKAVSIIGYIIAALLIFIIAAVLATLHVVRRKMHAYEMIGARFKYPEFIQIKEKPIISVKDEIKKLEKELEQR